ncbi:ketoacyl-ACP synthase III [Corynebacterium belfantii]|uniref:Ketoacyl-ACP synthase III n=1 Tax=Corynebacterium belfantii TaxID=2014537 RepID=A0ABS0LEE5_9CORY|nr:ketoacyl-ACP synthase III [Corynebacterium belfantii]OLN14952.1 3-oxoacyl-ACP synthase [Corynebacterium diphtheriae subsp. lausannense]MBG9329101.1 ketoacyl-ACP synthase III [Corynebacterium belfantii]MBG9347776.1 ketoacyl-ACP synthase III [Corynebacterium belfantii]MBG9350259.1 ketoacyl-ACP synthase III [Corynebacterium belfantii]MBG9354982.1 ketoacyl-ACP synthase III [Corynebacterium belfantii]
MNLQLIHDLTPSEVAFLPPTRLGGIAHYFPGAPVSNDYFQGLPELGIDDDWIQKHTGIRSRHWPDETHERPVEMACHAVRQALDLAGVSAEQIDLVIGTTSTTRPRVNPSSLANRYMDISLPLQAQCGLTNAACFDVTAVACAGFLYGSAVAMSMMAALGMRNALVVCAENPRPILNFDYKYSALFGAGAAAAVWKTGDGPGRLCDIVLHANGQHFGAFDIDDQDKMLMKGKVIGDLGPGLLASAARELMERNQMQPADVDWFIPHQGNLNMIEAVCDLVEIPREVTLTNIQSRGNTSSVSIPSCLSENLAAGVIKPGDIVLSVGIGRGLSWGGMLFHA